MNYDTPQSGEGVVGVLQSIELQRTAWTNSGASAECVDAGVQYLCALNFPSCNRDGVHLPVCDATCAYAIEACNENGISLDIFECTDEGQEFGCTGRGNTDEIFAALTLGVGLALLFGGLCLVLFGNRVKARR